MLAIRRVLHPTDFSDRSRAAFELACSLARDYAAELLVLHVIPPTPLVTPDGMFIGPSENADWARERLEQLVTGDQAVSIGHRLVDGYPVDEILKVARTLPADLIVMGTHGWGGLARLLLGSVAEGVMREASCPVLTVTAKAPALAEQAPKPQAAAAGQPTVHGSA